MRCATWGTEDTLQFIRFARLVKERSKHHGDTEKYGTIAGPELMHYLMGEPLTACLPSARGFGGVRSLTT
jgi:hypothetical protein